MALRLESSPQTPSLLTRLSSRSRSGISGEVGQAIARIMRFGPGSVQDQFAKQSLDSIVSGRRAWPSTKPFGNRPPPSASLQRTGRTLSAWLGADGASITEVGPNSVAIGVRGSVLPQAVVHQTGAVVRAKTRGPSGKLTMQIFLGKTFGVWMPEARLLAGLVIPARAVGVSAGMLNRAGVAILRNLTGQGGQDVSA